MLSSFFTVKELGGEKRDRWSVRNGKEEKTSIYFLRMTHSCGTSAQIPTWVSGTPLAHRVAVADLEGSLLWSRVSWALFSVCTTKWRKETSSIKHLCISGGSFVLNNEGNFPFEEKKGDIFRFKCHDCSFGVLREITPVTRKGPQSKAWSTVTL